MSSQRGFTVIELLVALTISALLLTVVYRAFNSAAQTRSSINSGNSAHHIGRVLSSRIGRELLSLQFRSGDADSSFRNTLEAGVRTLAFTSSASTPLSTQSGLPSRIVYRLRQASGDEQGPFVLERSEQSALTVGTPRLVRIIDGVARLSFQTYADGQWADEWDSDQSGSLPEAVSMAFERQDDERAFRTAWPIAAFGG